MCLSLSLAWAAPVSRYAAPEAPDVGTPTLEILPETLPVAIVGVHYNQGLRAIGGVPPHWVFVPGTLPPGFVFHHQTVVGIPTVPGIYTFTAIAIDSSGLTGERAYTLEVVDLQPQTITFPAQAVAQRPFFPGGTFAVDPLATGGASGNPVTYTAGPSNVCTISGITVTMLYPGACAITASQAGGGVYAPAAPVSQTVVLVLEAIAVPVLSQAALAVLAALLAGFGLWWRRVH